MAHVNQRLEETIDQARQELQQVQKQVAEAPHPDMGASLPRLVLRECQVNNEFLTLVIEVKDRITDPRHVIATLLREEMQRWKQSSPEWLAFVPWQARLEQASQDLADAERAEAAAQAAWQSAIAEGGEVAALERNLIEAKLVRTTVSERAAALRGAEAEKRQSLERAWRAHMAGVLAERRRLCEEIIRQARERVTQTMDALALLSINEEVRLAMTLALGQNGLYGLSPKI